MSMSVLPLVDRRFDLACVTLLAKGNASFFAVRCLCDRHWAPSGIHSRLESKVYLHISKDPEPVSMADQVARSVSSRFLLLPDP